MGCDRAAGDRLIDPLVRQERTHQRVERHANQMGIPACSVPPRPPWHRRLSSRRLAPRHFLRRRPTSRRRRRSMAPDQWRSRQLRCRSFTPNRTRRRHRKAENILMMGRGTTSTTEEAAATNRPRTPSLTLMGTARGVGAPQSLWSPRWSWKEKQRQVDGVSAVRQPQPTGPGVLTRPTYRRAFHAGSWALLLRVDWERSVSHT